MPIDNQSEIIKAAALERYKMLPSLRDACFNCRMCELGWSKACKDGIELDPHVFSNFTLLSTTARFLIVGQNPGWNEIKEGFPFVGPSGGNFDKALARTVWTRDNFYITNVSKCFSAGNHPPTQRQIEKCEPFFCMELEIVKPILIIAFGGVAFNMLCSGNFSDNIGKVIKNSKFNIPVFTTFHPSPLNLIDPIKNQKFNKDIEMLGKIMNYYLSPF